MKTSLNTKLSELPQNRSLNSSVKALKKLGINTVEELLYNFPYRYVDFSNFSKISTIQAGEIVTIKAKIKTIHARFSFKTRRSLCEAVVSDDTGSIKITWFNQGYLAKILKPGEEVFFSGKIQQYRGLQLINPIHEIVSGQNIHTGRIVPIYHMTEGLYHKSLRSLVKELLTLADSLEDLLPKKILKDFHIKKINETIKEIHFPEQETELKKAKERIIFEEILIQQLAVQTHKAMLEKQNAQKIEQQLELIKKFLTTLPFQLTASQKRALWDIVQDISTSKPMNRLLEGDVGSGKTLVALISALLCAKIGFQVALLAPTEILARQHFETFSGFLKGFLHANEIGLYTQNFNLNAEKVLTKKSQQAAITKGEQKIIIGTHALLSGVAFKQLTLVIIDEQHRFGVQQRALLVKQVKKDNAYTPHLLSMSATPIPRTLALAYYGDLEISRLKHLPSGRKKIITKIVNNNDRLHAYDFIRKQIASGRQAFIVTPRVEESDVSTVKSAKAESARLQKEIFPKAKIGLVHGKLSGQAKEEVMNDFNNKKLDILVATSVIEIGIDIPNATVMIIEDAESFGLAQLHQLRGRVGRSEYQSYCLLFTQSQNSESIKRLEEFSKIEDGAKLAELDLEQRGFGSLFGNEQTGFNLKFSGFFKIEILEKAKQAASLILKESLDLKKYPALQNKVRPLLAQIHLE